MALAAAVPLTWPPLRIYFMITVILSMVGWTGLARTVRSKLLQQAQNVRAVALTPWLLIPAIWVVVTVLVFNFVGDGLRDAADPYK